MFLAVLERVTEKNPRSALVVGVAFGLLATVLTVSPKAALATAVALGGFVLWGYRWQPAAAT